MAVEVIARVRVSTNTEDGGTSGKYVLWSFMDLMSRVNTVTYLKDTSKIQDTDQFTWA